MGKIRFLTDEDFKSAILAGVRRRLPELDILRTQDVGLRTFRDERILEFAAAENRIVLTHDVATMRRHANARVTDLEETEVNEKLDETGTWFGRFFDKNDIRCVERELLA